MLARIGQPGTVTLLLQELVVLSSVLRLLCLLLDRASGYLRLRTTYSCGLRSGTRLAKVVAVFAPSPYAVDPTPAKVCAAVPSAARLAWPAPRLTPCCCCATPARSNILVRDASNGAVVRQVLLLLKICSRNAGAIRAECAARYRVAKLSGLLLLVADILQCFGTTSTEFKYGDRYEFICCPVNGSALTGAPDAAAIPVASWFVPLTRIGLRERIGCRSKIGLRFLRCAVVAAIPEFCVEFVGATNVRYLTHRILMRLEFLLRRMSRKRLRSLSGLRVY